MKRILIGLGACLMSITLEMPQSHGQSWQEWVKDNPAYSKPDASIAPSSPPPAQSLPPDVKKPVKAQPIEGHLPSPPVSTSPSKGAFETELSTHNPLFEQRFLAGCQLYSQEASYCRCALKEIQNNYTFQEVNAMAERMKTQGQFSPEMIQIALRCVS